MAGISEVESNNTRALADTVTLNSNGQGSVTTAKVNPLSDVDYFKITTPSFSGSTTLTATMRPTAADGQLDAKVQLQNSSGTVLTTKDSGFDNTPETLTFAVTGNTTYYIVCSSADFSSSGNGDYTLTISVPPPNQAPTTPGSISVTAITTDGATASWGASSDADGDTITYEVQYSRAYDLTDPWHSVGTTTSLTLPISGLAANTQYSVQVKASDGRGGVSSWNENVGAFTTLAADLNDQISEATPLGSITQTLSATGAIDSATDVDIFSFTVAAGQRISFDIDLPTGSSLDSYLRLFDGNGTQLAVSDDKAGPGESPGSESYLEYSFTTGGIYYIGVSGFNNSNYNPVSGTGDVAGSTGAFTLIVSPGLAGVIRKPGDSTDYLVDILRFGTAPLAINTNQRTWIVIHGWLSSRTNENIATLATNLAQAQPGDQVLTLDWSAAAVILNPFFAEDAIVPVAEWAATTLKNYGFQGTNLNLVGHSFGSYVADEIAQRIPSGVNTIVTLDPAANILGGYDPVSNNEVNFARDSAFSWSFHASDLGNDITPLTSDESFFVGNSGHGDVVFLFAFMLANPTDPVGQYFLLNYLLSATLGPWLPNQFTSPINGESSILGYEAVIAAASGGKTPQSINFNARSVTTPTFSPNGGNFEDSVAVTLACGTSGATIRYTLNGSDPTSGSTASTGTPLTLVSSGTVKARAFKNGYNDSAIASASFTVTPAPKPTMTTSSSGNNLTLLWSNTATGYRIQSTLSFAPPVTWSNVTGSFQTNGGNISIALPMTGTQKFYRLIKP